MHMNASQIAALSAELAAYRGPAAVAVAIVTDSARLLGAHQRCTDASTPTFRRASGGNAYALAPNHVYCALTLPHPAALVTAALAQLLNRYVRPALATLTKHGAKTSYFGRDWLSARSTPIAGASYTYCQQTGAVLVELVIGTQYAFAAPGAATYLGKPPAALAEMCARAIEPAKLAAQLAAAYMDIGATPYVAANSPASAPTAALQTPWLAADEEAIGVVGAGQRGDGSIELGGEFCIDPAALRTLEHAINAKKARQAVALRALVHTHLNPAISGLFGVRELDSFTRVLAAALAEHDHRRSV
jgi:hypothetical protein